MSLEPDGVFISYRHATGQHLAGRINDFLDGEGFKPFLDVDGLRSGHFDDQLLREIERRPHFVLICTANSLDGCSRDGDWVRREISHAIRMGRNIVPIVDRGFEWPDRKGLPPEIADICTHHAFEFSHTHWKTTKHQLKERLQLTPAQLASMARRAPSGRGSQAVLADEHRADQLRRNAWEAVAAGDPKRAIMMLEELLPSSYTAVLRNRTPASMQALCQDLEKLADAFEQTHNIDSSLARYIEALRFRREAAELSGAPEDCFAHCSVLQSIARLEEGRGHLEGSVGRLRDAVEVCRKAAGGSESKAIRLRQASILASIVRIEAALGRPDAAAATAEESLGMLREGCQHGSDPAEHRALCEVLEIAAAAWESLKYADRPLVRLRESETIRRNIWRAARADGDAIALGETLRKIAEAEEARGRIEASMSARRDATAILREQSSVSGCTDILRHLHGCLLDLVDAGMRVGAYEGVLELLTESVEIALHSRNRGSTHGDRSHGSSAFAAAASWLRTGVAVLEKCAKLADHHGDSTSAMALRQASVELRQLTYELDSDHYRGSLSASTAGQRTEHGLRVQAIARARTEALEQEVVPRYRGLVAALCTGISRS